MKGKNMKKKFAENFIEFVNNSPSSYHVTKNCSDILDEKGFERLDPNGEWKLKPEGKYYIKRKMMLILIRYIYGLKDVIE